MRVAPVRPPAFAAAVLETMESLAVVVAGDGRIVWVNPAYEAVTGYSADEAVGRFVWEVHYPAENAEQARRTYVEFGESAPERVPGVLGGHLVTKSGQRRIISWSNTVVTSEGRKYAVSTGTDVTEWKSMQMRVLVADRMASVGTLAAGVAHEINNPLAYILANVSMATEALDDSGADLGDVRQMLVDARDGAARVQRIVGDLKTFSRVDDQAQVRSCDLRGILEMSTNMAWNEIRHRARLTKEYGDVPPVLGSEARLSQVFVNLLVNAAQAIREGAVEQNEIRIATRPAAGGGAVVVEIHDTGAGMSEEMISQIFDPFFTTKPVGEGTGLGLSICHSVVTTLGGEIAAESALGEGTVFRVTLPTATRSVQPEPQGTLRPQQRAERKAKVLVVDDDRLVATSIKRALRGHSVEVASTGREAVDRLVGDERFDLVICDLMMPDTTGMDVYDEVRARAPGVEESIVFLTGGAFTSRAEQFLNEVPNRHILKPFDVKELRKMVGEAVLAPD